MRNSTHACSASTQAFRTAWSDEVADAMRLALDELDYGLMLMTASGRLLQSNEIASSLLAAGRGLRLVGEHVVGVGDSAQSRWMAALRDAHRGIRRLVLVGEGEAALPIAVCPLVGASGGAGDAPPPPLLAMSARRGNCEELSIQAFGREHRLTPAEIEVLSRLMAGASPQSIAFALGRSESTVRTQVRAILGKTATRSIRNLLLRVARLPPIRPLRLERATSARAGLAG
ncbi:MAG: hypothetical protein RJA99_2693 [Pseudomonadota bacterium]|jgi:DNA-binding CsgD family transcriptional regulator